MKRCRQRTPFSAFWELTEYGVFFWLPPNARLRVTHGVNRSVCASHIIRCDAQKVRLTRTRSRTPKESKLRAPFALDQDEQPGVMLERRQRIKKAAADEGTTAVCAVKTVSLGSRRFPALSSSVHGRCAIQLRSKLPHAPPFEAACFCDKPCPPLGFRAFASFQRTALCVDSPAHRPRMYPEDLRCFANCEDLLKHVAHFPILILSHSIIARPMCRTRCLTRRFDSAPCRPVSSICDRRCGTVGCWHSV